MGTPYEGRRELNDIHGFASKPGEPLPNDDPDSFARKHTADEFRAYIKEHQTDFIEFKTKLLLQNETDPQKRADGIGSIVNSISLIPNQILRDTYIHTCAQRQLRCDECAGFP